MTCMETFKFDTEDGEEVYHYLYLYNKRLKAEEFRDKNGKPKCAVVADLKKLNSGKSLVITDIKIVKQRHIDR